MTRVFHGERTLLSPVLRPVERGIYARLRRATRPRSSTGSPTRSRCWRSASPASSSLYALQRLQDVLPFNPQGLDAVAPDLAFNTSVSFVTNTNWQSYTPETTMSYLVADGRADGAQLRLGRHRHRAGDRADPRLRAPLGADDRQFLGRSDPLHALHPAADLASSSACSSSGRACRRTSAPISTSPRWKAPSRSIAQGPVASQEVIKMLGTNGGGFFNANSAHPFENPNALTNLIADGADLLDRRRADQRVRPHGRRSAPGLGDLRA